MLPRVFDRFFRVPGNGGQWQRPGPGHRADGGQAGAMAAARPTGTEATGQSTSAPAMNSTLPVADIQAGAYAASHPTGTEPMGQSTSLPMVKSGTGS
jgi:hypothetical protein